MIMKRRGSIWRVCLAANVLFNTGATLAAEVASARSEVVISYISSHASCQGDATVVRNTNESARIYATISLPIEFKKFSQDRYFLTRALPNSATAGVLLLPGETRVLRCGADKWQVVGAYYPLADMSLPADPNPADKLALLFDTPEVCASGQQVIRAVNLHPWFGLVFQYTLPGEKAQTLALAPLDSMPLTLCTAKTPKITFSNFEFVKQ